MVFQTFISQDRLQIPLFTCLQHLYTSSSTPAQPRCGTVLEQPRLPIQALLQVHYSSVRPPADRSGVRLKLTDAALPFSAGMMMFASYFTIPPGLPSHHVPTRCCYSGFEPTHGFAYRVHTHALGR